MARAKRSFRRNDQSGLLWSAVGVVAARENIVPASSFRYDIVIVGTDIVGGQAQGQCTLLRIRGWLSMCVNESASGDCDWVGLIGVFDQNDDLTGPGGPELIASYSNEDILWTGGGQGNQWSAVPTAVTNFMETTREIDVKAKRRLRSGQVVSLVVTNIGTADLSTLGVLRGLCKLR